MLDLFTYMVKDKPWEKKRRVLIVTFRLFGMVEADGRYVQIVED